MSTYDFEEQFTLDTEKWFYQSIKSHVEQGIKEIHNLRSNVSIRWHKKNHSKLPQLAYERMLALQNHLEILENDDPNLFKKYKNDFIWANKKIDAELDQLEKKFSNQIDKEHRYFSDEDAFSKSPTIQEKTKVKGGAGHEWVSEKKKINKAYLDDIHKEAERYIQNNPNNYLTKDGNPNKPFYSTVHRRLDDHAQVDGEIIKKPHDRTVKNRLIDWLNEKS